MAGFRVVRGNGEALEVQGWTLADGERVRFGLAGGGEVELALGDVDWLETMRANPSRTRCVVLAAPGGAVLSVVERRESRSGEWTVVEGQVRNIGVEALGPLVATAAARDAGGQTLAHEQAALELTRLEPGEASAFRILLRSSLAPSGVELGFRTLLGQALIAEPLAPTDTAGERG